MINNEKSCCLLKISAFYFRDTKVRASVLNNDFFFLYEIAEYIIPLKISEEMA